MGKPLFDHYLEDGTQVLTISFLQFSNSTVTVAPFKSMDPCQFTPGPTQGKAVFLCLLQHAAAHACFLGKPGHEGVIGILISAWSVLEVHAQTWSQGAAPEAHNTALRACDSQCSTEKQNYSLASLLL